VAYYVLWTVVVAIPLVADFGMGLPELVVWAALLVAAVVVTYRHWTGVRRHVREVPGA
jgi:hypothetical protein